MFAQIMNLLGTAISFAIGLFTGLLDRAGMKGIFLGVFAAFLAIRFLIVPLTGGGKKGGNKADE